MAPILPEIEVFLARYGMSASRLGQLAVNDKNLVKQLRKGRRVWPEMETKIRIFMAAHQRQHSKAPPRRRKAA